MENNEFENNKKKGSKTPYVIGIVLALILVVTVTLTSYAYFSATVTNSKTPTNSVVTTGSMEIEFSDGPEVKLENALPGQHVVKTFSVKNVGTVDTTYDIYLSDLINTFADKTDLVYTLTSSNGANVSSQTQMPSVSTKIVSAYSLPVGATHEYTLRIDFKETNDNQDDNKDKEFSTVIRINEVRDIAKYKDNSGANEPELYDGMVPVYYEDGKTLLADTTKEWYDYDSHNWANAVLVSNVSEYLESDGTPKKNKVNQEVSDILQYYVWIPRYKYELFNTNNESVNEQMINVTFESGTASTGSGSTNGQELTHPAFTFGSTELKGFWVGKFETTGSSSTPTILPNSYSLTNMNISTQFNSARSIEGNYGTNTSEIDTHMMKNMEWGAVVYLSASKYGLYKDASTCNNSDNTVTGVGCQIWINNVHTQANNNWGPSITGCSALTSMNDGIRNNTTACGTEYEWNGRVNNGRSSTTGNLYGIYDMSGGAWEYVMGNRGSSTSVYETQNSGFTSQPESKYIDIYEATSSNTDHAKGKLGDATKETLKTFGSLTGGWYSDYAYFVESSYAWFVRGGSYHPRANAGAFTFFRNPGTSYAEISFRVVLSAQ